MSKTDTKAPRQTKARDPKKPMKYCLMSILKQETYSEEDVTTMNSLYNIVTQQKLAA